MRSRMLSFFLLVMVAGVPAAQSLTIYCEDAPPFSFVAPDGRLSGLAIDLVREIQSRAGNSDPIQMVPWARGYASILKQPDTVLFAMTRTKAREPLFHWVGPIHETEFAFYARAESPLKIRSLDDARKVRSIGVYAQDARDQYLTEHGFTNLVRVYDSPTNVKKLGLGQIDLYVGSRSEIGPEAAAAGYSARDFKEVFPLMRVQTYVAFSQNSPSAVIAAWAEALESMKKDGTFERIYRQYLPENPLPGPALAPL